MMIDLSLSEKLLSKYHCVEITILILQLLPTFRNFRIKADFSGIVAQQDPNTALIPKDPKSYSKVIQWCSFANHEVLPQLGAWFGPTLGRDPYNKKSVDAAEVLIKKTMKYLDGYLLDHTYLVGERLTIADLVMSAYLDRGFQYVCPPI
jgi:glutathione S-transferase